MEKYGEYLNRTVSEGKNQKFDISDYVRQVWMLTDLEDKRLVALEMVNQMGSQKKADVLKVQIMKARKPEKIDTIVSNISMSGEGLKVIK